MNIVGPAPGDPAVVDTVLRALPAWFGIEQSILDYVAAAPGLSTWTAFEDEEAIAFLAIKEHFAQSAELHVMGVLPVHQGRGIGSALLRAAESWLCERGVCYLHVKTLAPAAGSEPYARTRAFYEVRGFAPLEVFDSLWDVSNPCLLYVKALETPV